ncbi:MAG: penicillin-binding protein [Myxococcota bacterium]
MRTAPTLSPRLLAVAALLFAPLCAVVYRAASLQLGHGEEMRDMAEDQYLHAMQLSAPRGNIVDRAGRPLAVSLKVPSIYAEPRRVGDKRGAAVALSRPLGMPVGELEKKLRSERGFAWLKRRVTPEVATAVRKLAIPGIAVTEESSRFYPNRELASHVLGYTNVDGHGLEGMEAEYDERLAGRALKVDAFRDARGGRLLMGELGNETLVGDELTLTLDAQIQFIAEQAIGRAVTEHGAVGGFAVVMDPRTGAILALANYPGFNPNDVKAAKSEARRNRAVVDAFEPGSTMKVLLLASALDAGIVKLTDLINCENGVYAVGRHRIRDTHKADILTVEQVLAQSSNIGALKIGTQLGRGRWGKALTDWGFGKRTGLGINGETPGIMAAPERWSDAALATISFGQGISVSGVQMINAVAAVANGGVLMQPRLVEKIASADGKTVEEKGPVALRRVVGAKAAALTLKAMEKVVAPDGTAPLAAVPGVQVAGKTGTAQKVDPGQRGYGDKRIASFVGVAPSKDPKLVIFVVVDEPQDSPYGGVVAAPAFREIAMAALPLMGVGVEQPVAQEKDKKTDTVVASSADALAGARALAARLAADDPVDGIDEGGAAPAQGAVVPDLMGKSPRAAIKEALAVGLEPTLEGTGVVVAQRPEAGKPLGGERTIRLKLGHQEDG